MSINDNKQLKVIVFCKEFSTRFLFEVLADSDNYELVFVTSKNEFSSALVKNNHDVYVIDICDGDNGAGHEIYGEIVNKSIDGFKGQRRIILVTMKPTPPEANHMSKYGPLCFLEYNFTRTKLVATLELIQEIKDTGVRVTMDPNFFDVSVFLGK